MALNNKITKASEQFPASFNFLSQVTKDIGYIEAHPMLSSLARAKLKQARETVSDLCYALHGQHPTT